MTNSVEARVSASPTQNATTNQDALGNNVNLNLSLPSRLGAAKFAQTLEATLASKTALASFRLYLVTAQQLESALVVNLLALRETLVCAIQRGVREATAAIKSPTDHASIHSHLQCNISSINAQVGTLRNHCKQTTGKLNQFPEVAKKLDAVLRYASEDAPDHAGGNADALGPQTALGAASTFLFKRSGSYRRSTSKGSRGVVSEGVIAIDNYLSSFYTLYQRSELYARYQFKYFNQPCTALSLADLLSHEMASVAFSDFLELEQAGAILEFLFAVSAFQETFADSPEIQRRADAMQIYLRFISMQATQKVGFGDRLRHTVESSICVAEGTEINIDCFGPAEQQALTTLNSVYFPAFRASTVYTHFLQDLLRGCRLLSNDEDGDDAFKNAHGISTSDFEFDDGHGSSHSSDLKRELSSANYSIAEDYYLRQLINPDILWYRSPRAGQFRSIGSVDSLGRFSIDKDLQKYLIRHVAALQATKTGVAKGEKLTSRKTTSGQDTVKSRRTSSGFALPDDFTEKAYHVQTQQVPSNTNEGGRFARVFKKFVGVTSPAEEQDAAASMAKEFLHSLLAQNELLS